MKDFFESVIGFKLSKKTIDQLYSLSGLNVETEYSWSSVFAGVPKRVTEMAEGFTSYSSAGLLEKIHGLSC